MLKKIIVFFSVALSFHSWGKGKFDVSFGYFDFNAKTQIASVSKSNFGVYDLTYRYPISKYFEMGFGYGLLMTETLGGDMSFGPNIELLAYPLSSPNKMNYFNENINIEASETLRPYLGFSFHQRQFESIQSSYAGFGFVLGTEYWYDYNLGIKTQIRIISLSGPQNSSASQTDLTFGYITEF